METQLNLPLKAVLAHVQARIMSRSTYFGIQTFKSPTDFWVYQELLCEQKPDFIVEIGNWSGGSALALAHLCDALGHGQIIAIDINHKQIDPLARAHPRITWIESDATACYAAVRAQIPATAKVLVIEDSAHTYDNTLSVLRTYSALIKPGEYLVVEDSICWHGLDVGPNPGPYEAIETFLAENNQFESDRDRESFLITWNPKGYLRRVA